MRFHYEQIINREESLQPELYILLHADRFSVRVVAGSDKHLTGLSALRKSHDRLIRGVANTRFARNSAPELTNVNPARYVGTWTADLHAAAMPKLLAALHHAPKVGFK